MKLNRIFSVVLATLALAACSDIDNIVPESGTMLASQVQETNIIAPSRAEASFAGMFSSIGYPAKMYSTPDDWQFLMIMFCNDLEGADALIADSNFNWFSVCGELSSRNANYRNPYIRYRAPYNMIANANTFISGYPEDVTDDHSLNMIAQAKCLRAWSYLNLAPMFQFNYQIAADKPCVPIATPETEDFTNNPRASVKEVYDFILSDLNAAIEVLERTSEKRTSKMNIDANVAHGLRARAYLDMGEWSSALADAQAAANGYTVASREDVSKPAFYDIQSEANWIWGYDMTSSAALNNRDATTSSWLRSFSAWGYAAACQVYTCINNMLWDMIPSTDIRKQRWVDEDLSSTIADQLEWPGLGPVAFADDGGEAKLPFVPYTNVKFGCFTIGTTANDEDMPLMRVEEMILIQAECYARMNQNSQAIAKLKELTDKRDTNYDVNGRNLSLLDEIWFQRRVELWGEGFFVPDARRLNKPVVRFHDESTNFSPAFRFNLAADDPWALMRFPQGEMNTNFAIVDNEGGHQPVTDEGKSLRDGVTD